MVSTYRNVTAIATGAGGIPIEAEATMTASATIHLVNVIAYAGPGAISFQARTDNSGAAATISATHTNYKATDTIGINATIVDGLANQAEEPAFVDPAAGDYRQAPGAYTIDAGLDDPLNGDLDLDGGARMLGKTDIGAHEFVPAPPAPAPPPAETTPPAAATPTPAAAAASSRA